MNHFEHPPHEIEVEVRPAGSPQYAARIALHGEHDLATAPALREALNPIFGDVLVDLSACTFVDSTVISSLISAAQDLQREGHSLDLLVPPGNLQVARTLEIVHVRDLLRVFPALPAGDGSA